MGVKGWGEAGAGGKRSKNGIQQKNTLMNYFGKITGR